MNVLRAIYGEIENGRLVSAAGACFFQIVGMKRVIYRQVINPYDSSPSNPDSPYYDDQSKLFVQEKMRVA